MNEFSKYSPEPPERSEDSTGETSNADKSGINDVSEYRRSLIAAGENSLAASLDRSEYFRHKKDFELFADEVKKARQEGRKISMLDVGVGNLQEPISYLAAVFSESAGKKIDDLVDLEIVEIRDRESLKEKYSLGKQMFSPDKPVQPKMYKDSFVLVEGQYVPQPEIKEYLEQRLSDQTKSHFGTAIENFSRAAKTQYDVVSCNNVLQHLGGTEGYWSPFKNASQNNFERYYEEVRRIMHLVKEGGIIFLHTPAPGNQLDTKSKGTSVILKNIPELSEEFDEVVPGVYRRKVSQK